MRDKLFKSLSKLVVTAPWFIVFGALFLLLASFAAIEGIGLKMETRILDLLPKNDPAAIEYNKIVEQFSSASQIMVGIKGTDRAMMTEFAEKLGPLSQKATYTTKDQKQAPYIKRATIKMDAEFFAEHGMMLTKVKDLSNMEELFQNLEMAELLTAYNDFFEREYIEDTGSLTERQKEDNAINALKGIVAWLEGIAQVSNDEALHKTADHVTSLLSTGDPYLFSEDDGMLIVMLVPAIAMDLMEETLEGATSLKKLIADLNDQYPNLEVTLSGLAIMSVEEMEVTEQDMGWSTVIALVLVLILFIIAFRMWTAPLLAMINLIIGIVWTAGLIALTFGRLNLFTLMFAVILVGLGIDFAIHLNAAFSTARSKGASIADAIQTMYAQSGPGVITGAVTTAAAFAALAFTGLDAFVELGGILSSGILLTLLSSIVVLPAMYVIHGRVAQKIAGDKPVKHKKTWVSLPYLGKMGRHISRFPIPVTMAMLVLTIGFGYFSKTAQFEPDMLEIEPADMPSVVLHKEILKRFEISPDFAMITTDDFEASRKIVKQMKKNRLVGRVDAITEFLPTKKQSKKRARIAKRIGSKMKDYLEPKLTLGLPGGAPIAQPPRYMDLQAVSQDTQKQFLSELDRLQMNVQEMEQMAFTGMKSRLHRTCTAFSGGDDIRFSKILNLKKHLAQDLQLGPKMAQYQRAYLPLLAEKIEKMANPTPVTLDTLPENIKDRYLSGDGHNLITIYSAVNLWDGNKMELFNAATSKISSHFTGTVLLMDRLIELIASKGLMATILAFGTVIFILLIDFRSIKYALLGAVPLITGFVWMVGLFVLLGYKFDVANVMAIPLILGIGIDDAVHVLHAIRKEGILKLSDILKHTGRALVLTSLTTGIAFGSIATASHRGMAGMGMILVLGVGCCLITSIVLLPALCKTFFKTKQSNKMEAQND